MSLKENLYLIKNKTKMKETVREKGGEKKAASYKTRAGETRRTFHSFAQKIYRAATVCLCPRPWDPSVNKTGKISPLKELLFYREMGSKQQI